MLIRRRHLGIPSESRDSFSILIREKVVQPQLGEPLKRTVDFRNIAVHQYSALDLSIVEAIIGSNLDDLLAYAEIIRTQLQFGMQDTPK
jgi:uncharacterized protein YutE (UPF0331/DUF86 family)